MKINYNKFYNAIRNEYKLPRKLKKIYLGRKLNKTKLKRLLNTVVVISSAKTMYEEPRIKPYLFCPKCGCKRTTSTGNMAEYPEHWENFYCARCNYRVAQIDNSPFYHCLEFENFSIDY